LDLDGELGSSEDTLLEENSSMTKKTIYLIPLILLSFWMIPEEGKANEIVQQIDSSNESETMFQSSQTFQSLGTGLSGNVKFITFYINSKQTLSTSDYRAIINCYEDSLYTTPCSPSGATSETLENLPYDTKYQAIFTFTTPYELDNTKYYTISNECTSSCASLNKTVYGTTASSYANGSSSKNTLGTPFTNIADLYFKVTDTEENNTNTRIIRLNNPTSNEEGLTNPITFNFDYYYNSTIGGYATSGVKVIDILSNFQYTPVEEAIITSGQTTFTEQMTLNSDSCYSWQPYLRGASTTIYGNTQLFETGTGCTGFQSTVGDTSTTSFFAFLNVTQQLRNKSPVGYIYIMSDILNNLDQISASSSVDLSMNLASSSAGYFTGTVDFFSADTIGEYLDDDMTNLLRNFMVVITYITTGMTLFALGRKTFT